MKVAIYIEQGVTQLVLTPEGEWEQSVCDKLATNGEKRVQILRGSFYETRGGWTRYAGMSFLSGPYGTQESDDKSLILRVEDAPPQVASRAEPAPAVDLSRSSPNEDSVMPTGSSQGANER